ncbi:MAG: hydroxyacid dehydrogenase [Myxococcota bacterium]|nr:hydroxyacid dehydrogenase [Myxococcota bacterium]
MSIRVLACDDISSVGLDVLREAGFEVDSRPGVTERDLLGGVGDYDAILVRSRTRVSAKLLAAASRLRVVGRAGFGMDRIDLDEATARGVVVLHSPDGNSVTAAAAEFTIGLIFSLARNIPRAHVAMRRQRWEKRRNRGIQIQGKTLGILGMGKVGRAVAERGVALGMVVKGHDPLLTKKAIRSTGAQAVDWDELLSSSDFLTVHVNASPLTLGLVGSAAFARMKEGVRLVNCSRGGVVSEAALVSALKSGKVAAAAVDVFEQEPPWGCALLESPRVIVTPHLVASTFEAQIQVAVDLAEQVRDFFLEGEVRGIVNAAVLETGQVETRN